MCGLAARVLSLKARTITCACVCASVRAFEDWLLPVALCCMRGAVVAVSFSRGIISRFVMMVHAVCWTARHACGHGSLLNPPPSLAGWRCLVSLGNTATGGTADGIGSEGKLRGFCVRALCVPSWRVSKNLKNKTSSTLRFLGANY